MKIKLTAITSAIVDIDDAEDYQNWKYYDFLDYEIDWEVDHWQIEEVEEDEKD